GVEKNEDPEVAATRELYEETSIRVNRDMLALIGTERLPLNKKWPQVNMSFYKTKLIRHQNPAVIRPLEVLEAQWFPMNQLPKKDSEIIDLAMEILKDN